MAVTNLVRVAKLFVSIDVNEMTTITAVNVFRTTASQYKADIGTTQCLGFTQECNTDQYKPLCVTIDSKVTMAEHIDQITCKISTGVSILTNAKRARITTSCNSYLFPHLTYYINVWRSAFETCCMRPKAL